MRQFVLIVGAGRSGSTLLGAILDAHPHAMIANETAASANFWRNLGREDILREIFENAEVRRHHGRLSEGYEYSIERMSPQVEDDVVIAGDKIWNPATLLMHGDAGLLSRLEQAVGVPVKLVHAVRNPFDVIATMHARSGATLADRTLWYFMFCDAMIALHARFDETRLINCHHEVLLEQPDSEIRRLAAFLRLECPGPYADACKRRMFSAPKKTRHGVAWDRDLKSHIRQKMRDYTFLHRYECDEDFE